MYTCVTNIKYRQIMAYTYTLACLIAYFSLTACQTSYDPNMDSTLFAIQWPGAGATNVNLGEITEDNSMMVTTKDNEKYRCVLPATIVTTTEESDGNYFGPTEFELLEPLMDQKSCSYRIEAYWTYELCHGRHIRQYHEEKEAGKKPKLQEYFLGRFDRKQGKEDAMEKKIEKREKAKAKERLEKEKVRTKKVEGIEVPYYEMDFADGTPCDLTSGTRKAKIHYTCHREGKGEIYEIKETSTCEYEVVILTNSLCSHPAFSPPPEPVNYIRCLSLDSSPTKPKSLLDFEADSMSSKYNKRQEAVYERIHKKTTSTFYQKKTNVRQEEQPKSEEPPAQVKQPQQRVPATQHSQAIVNEIGPAADKQLIAEFLTGEYCIRGGTGWWKHEFCYGNRVLQYHEDKSGKTVIVLGMWDEAEHKQWLAQNPNKQPKLKHRKSVNLFYGKGETCDLTGKPRTTEVKLKCKDNPTQPHAVAIYLVEPNPCEYIVVVESPLLCSLIEEADNFGLFTAPAS